MKVLIANAKGGAGKSTVSMQIVVPFLNKYSGQNVYLYEFDDENEDSKSYIDSRLVQTQQVHVENNDLRGELQNILLKDQNLCIDVGANKTATLVIDALISSGMIYCLDLVVIPLMDGEIDAVSALNTYITLKDAHNDLKVVFALGRANHTRDLHCQFDIFLGDQRGFFDQRGMIDMVKEEDRYYFPVHDSDTIKYCRQFGTTVMELSGINRDVDGELKDAIGRGASSEEIKFLSFKRALKSDCLDFVAKTFEPAYKVMMQRIERNY